MPDGPHKRDLDEIASIRPIVLFDNSGHSVWVNSAMLRTLGIDRDTPDLSENLSYIVRDEAGEPTGWLKEFVLTHHTGGKSVPSPDKLKERMLKYLKPNPLHGNAGIQGCSLVGVGTDPPWSPFPTGTKIASHDGPPPSCYPLSAAAAAALPCPA